MVYDDSCTAEDIYEYARYTMEGLQGIFVAFLFCYANSEVSGMNNIESIEALLSLICKDLDRGHFFTIVHYISMVLKY